MYRNTSGRLLIILWDIHILARFDRTHQNNDTLISYRPIRFFRSKKVFCCKVFAMPVSIPCSAAYFWCKAILVRWRTYKIACFVVYSTVFTSRSGSLLVQSRHFQRTSLSCNTNKLISSFSLQHQNLVGRHFLLKNVALH